MPPPAIDAKPPFAVVWWAGVVVTLRPIFEIRPMPPTAISTLYTDQASIGDVLSTDGVDMRVDDDGTGMVSSTEDDRIDRAINWATARINRRLQPLYDAADLVLSWTVWNWASVFGAWWLSTRRGNIPAAGIQMQYDLAVEELDAVAAGLQVLEDISLRNDLAPTLSNVRLDSRYPQTQLRVQRKLSRGPNVQRVDRARDYTGDMIYEPPVY